MARTKEAADNDRSGKLISAAVVGGALYVARDILLPFALSILLSFLLAPLVERLEKWKFGRIPAVLAVVALAFIGFAALAFVMAQQVYDLAYKLPDYTENIVAKVQAFQSDETGVLDRVRGSVEEMRSKLSIVPESLKEPDGSTGSNDPLKDPEAEGSMLEPGRDVTEPPVRVELVESISARQVAQRILQPMISPLASAGMVIVFVVFMLLKREDLRNRVIRLVGGTRLNVTTQALDEAASRVSRYLLMQLIINAAYGLVICVGLLFIGLPNAFLWGTLTAVLRFLPYIGPWIAAIMPVAISLAVFDSWLQPALVIVLFIVNELISNNVIEPWLYGASTGISTIGILASAVFWTWLWGPLGLVMATPLTVCLTVVGRYVPQLAFFNTLLSEQDALPPASRFYQRLLAMDPEEATEVAEDYLAANSLTELYDSVLLPALTLAERDRHEGLLADAKQRLILQTTREIIDDVGKRVDEAASTGTTINSSAGDARALTNRRVLCLPARDEADEIAGLMLVQLLGQRGVAARVVSTKTLSGEMIEQVSAEQSSVVCVSALPPFAATHARYLSKRLRPRFPQLKLVVGLWQETELTTKTQDRLIATGINRLVTSLSEAVVELESLSRNSVIVQDANAQAGSP